MSDEFYIDLMSSSSKKHYPENTLNEFKVHLDHEINLDGQYKVGLTNVTIPYQRFNLVEDVDIFFELAICKITDSSVKFDYKTTKQSYKFRANYYEDGLVFFNELKFIQNFITNNKNLLYDLFEDRDEKRATKNFFNLNFNRSQQKNQYDFTPGCIKFNVSTTQYICLFYPKFDSFNFEKLLGISNENLYSRVKENFKNEIKRIKNESTNRYTISNFSNSSVRIIMNSKAYNILSTYVYIYIDFIEYHIVSDMYIPVLKIIPLNEAGVGIVTYNFSNTEFYKVNKNKINSIYISLRDQNGNHFTDIASPVHLTLKFIKN